MESQDQNINAINGNFNSKTKPKKEEENCF